MSLSREQLPQIDGAALRALLDGREPVWLVHAPGAADFRLLHIRDALALAGADQVRRALRPDDQIVIYGRDATCTASRSMVRDLLDHGYGRVRWYAEGLQGWVGAGGEVEGVDVDDSSTQAPPQSGGPAWDRTDRHPDRPRWRTT
jgi:rhodanese-related sulfurtransferase